MFTKFLNLPIFICSFIVGVLFVQLSSPSNTIVLVYPTPDNIKHIEYKDKVNNCFVYDVNKIKCPSDQKDIKKIPVQMGKTKRELPMVSHKIGITNVNKI